MICITCHSDAQLFHAEFTHEWPPECFSRPGVQETSFATGTPREAGPFEGDAVPESFAGQVLHPFVRIGKDLRWAVLA